MKKKVDKKNISIRNSIVIVFMFSVIVSVLIIGFTVFTSWKVSVNRTIKVIAKDMNHEINQDISHMIGIPYEIVELNEKVISNGVLDLTDQKEVEKYFAGVLVTQIKELYSFTYGTEEGNYYGARRLEDNTIEFIRNDFNTGGRTWYYTVDADYNQTKTIIQASDFDPRILEWYINAKKNHGPVYSHVYKHYYLDDLTVSASWPVYDGKDLKGVLGAHMRLSGLDTQLEHIVNEKQGYAFIFEEDTEALIANSMGLDNFSISENGVFIRNKVTDIENETIMNVYKEFKSNLNENFSLKMADGDYFVTAEKYNGNGLNWYIVSAVPYNLFMKDVKDNIFNTIIILIIATIISVIIYFIITHRLFRPIDTLIETMSKLSTGDFLQRVPISRNDEIGKISMIFNQTAEEMNKLVNHLEASVEERTADLMNVNEALRQTKEDLYLILDSTAEGIFGLDIKGNCTFCNDRCIELLGYKHQHDLIGKNMHTLIHHSKEDGTSLEYSGCKIMNTLQTGESAFVDNEVFWKADGSLLDVYYYSNPQLKDGVLSGAVITFTDATERRRNEEQIRYLSSHDALTGLLNRGCFERTLKRYDTKDNLPITIMFADLNGLKLVNDVFGHSSGDMLIKKAAEVLKKTCRGEDIIARVGGDEFIVLLPRTEARDATKIIERVKKELSKEKVNGLSCSMALGFDTKYSYYDDLEKIMSSAESEMYTAKLSMRKSFGNDTINTIMDALQQRSTTERVHSENIARLCEQMGREMNLSDPEIKKLRDAGYMHDIGKIVLSNDIIQGTRDLSDYESQMKRQHPVAGYRILNLFDDTLDLAEVVYYHHERYDGTGYPKGLKGDEIPLISRIIAIAEHYERLVERESVQGNLEWEDIYQRIRNGAGSSFDPDLVERFINMLKNYESKGKA